MAQFKFAKDIDDIVKMDGPMQNGPMIRWQRKAQETFIRVHRDDESAGGSSPMKARSKTPMKAVPAITPGAAKTPKTPGGKLGDSQVNGQNGKRSAYKPKTPSNKTPGRQPDRFIPSRTLTDMEFGHYAMMKREDDEPVIDEANCNVEYQKKLEEAMDVKACKILNFKGQAPQTQRPDLNNLQVVYSCGKSAVKQSASSRFVPKQPERVLDAPDLLDDYYLNLMDWSAANILSLALGSAVFLWNADKGSITNLMELSTPADYVSSVSWVQESAVLAVGISTGIVQLWDTEHQKLIRSMAGHSTRVGSLSWNNYILSSGARTGAIHHHDVRIANHQIASAEMHTQEVCGLRWSPDGRHLASGGNDNLLHIWSNQLGTGPVHTFTDHQAAVKAMAWCPWQSNLLATGGGTADRHIRLWNIQSGAVAGAHDTQSQVCSILWSSEHKELISGHGYALNHLRIWKYPSMKKVVDLTGHTSRVLCMAMSPDGTTVASAAADETIRLWKCFAVDKDTKKAQAKAGTKLTSGLSMCIR